MNYKNLFANILSIVRETIDNTNKNGIVIIIMLVVVAFLIAITLTKNDK